MFTVGCVFKSLSICLMMAYRSLMTHLLFVLFLHFPREPGFSYFAFFLERTFTQPSVSEQ